MTRMLISLTEDDKSWLARQAQQRHSSMAEVVRSAIRRYRSSLESTEPGLEALLEETSGIGSGEDGLQVQQRLRDEWR